eukprot:CAMPEP_0202877810 /NCGR_PEP_ID=MMETSP1391-20130828/31203_1 /ASSEMBLY_ACC=CAM_ASM_000867 /TAXON_ID=1034604 /ORGANISM="Chlamydomonas leiostraca, Strain SAG 11-49" /LENGTH=45 /DNA_ID= /DNA_START= /DNA_END= /DNA_ORIENTATION=
MARKMCGAAVAYGEAETDNANVGLVKHMSTTTFKGDKDMDVGVRA